MIIIKLIHRDIYIFFRFLASFGSISSIQSEKFFFFMPRSIVERKKGKGKKGKNKINFVLSKGLLFVKELLASWD